MKMLRLLHCSNAEKCENTIRNKTLPTEELADDRVGSLNFVSFMS